MMTAKVVKVENYNQQHLPSEQKYREVLPEILVLLRFELSVAP